MKNRFESKHTYCAPLIFLGQKPTQEKQSEADQEDTELAQFVDELRISEGSDETP